MLFECEDALNARLKEHEQETLRQDVLKMPAIQITTSVTAAVVYPETERSQSCTINEMQSVDTADNEKNELLLKKKTTLTVS